MRRFGPPCDRVVQRRDEPSHSAGRVREAMNHGLRLWCNRSPISRTGKSGKVGKDWCAEGPRRLPASGVRSRTSTPPLRRETWCRKPGMFPCLWNGHPTLACGKTGRVVPGWSVPGTGLKTLTRWRRSLRTLRGGGLRTGYGAIDPRLGLTPPARRSRRHSPPGSRTTGRAPRPGRCLGPP
jgi:hypothetical protein